jgi:transaldolase
MGVYKMKLKVFADGADINDMLKAYNSGSVSGFTTNPTLMKRSGITDYMAFAKEALQNITDMPISFEVFSDELEEMETQAYKLRDLAENVYVKIPVTNTKGVPTYDLINKLTSSGVKVNVTAIFTENQIKNVSENIKNSTPSVISIFAGRIANTGIDPEPIMKFAVDLTRSNPEKEILWASPREALNIIQAERCGCDIITVTPDILKAMDTFGKDLDEFSLETVKMFYDDACEAGFKI